MIYDMKKNFGKFFEDYKAGDIYKHWPGKTITESDNNLFSLLTMNHHPIHLDWRYASRSQHKQVLVVGTLVFSLAVGLTVSEVSGMAIANLGYQEIKHTHPVFINDTIYVKTKVLEKRVSQNKPDRGLVSVISYVYNQNDVQVLSFKRTILVPVRGG